MKGWEAVPKCYSSDTDINIDDDDIELEAHSPSYLSPTSKGVYNQWQIDETDELLVDGYFRECSITRPLSADVAFKIASYYTKSHSKCALRRKILQLRELRRHKMQKRKEYMKRISLLSCKLIVFISLMCSSDIAALVIINKYDCDAHAISNTPQNQWFGISDFLFIGSASHIVLIFLIIASTRGLQHSNLMVSIGIVLMSLIFMSCGVIGFLLHSKTLIYHPCSDVLISWAALKCITYMLFVPILLCVNSSFSQSVCPLFRIVITILEFMFSTDIAGLIIASNNGCDLAIDGESKFFMFGQVDVDTFLLYGCSIHICIGFIILYAFWWRCNIGLCTVVCVVLLLLSCGVIGCILYSKINQSTIYDKQCADVTITWAVLRFVDCVVLSCAAFMLFCALSLI
eukprot:194204_1